VFEDAGSAGRFGRSRPGHCPKRGAVGRRTVGEVVLVSSRTVHLLAVLCVLSWSALAVGVAYLTGVGLAPNPVTPPDVIAGPREPAPPAVPADPSPHPPQIGAADASTGSQSGSSGGPVTVVRHAEAGPHRNNAPAAATSASLSKPEPSPGPTGPPQRPRRPGPPADPPPVQPPIPPVDPNEVVDEVVDQVPGVGAGDGDRPRGVGPSATPPGHDRAADHLPPAHG
jgi:hypothetical protein